MRVTTATIIQLLYFCEKKTLWENKNEIKLKEKQTLYTYKGNKTKQENPH